MGVQAPKPAAAAEQTGTQSGTSRQSAHEDREYGSRGNSGFDRGYRDDGGRDRDRTPTIGWGQFNAQTGLRGTKNGDGEAHKISGYITEVLKKPGAVSKQDVLFFPFVLNGGHNGIPNERSAAVLAAVHQQTGVCYYAVIFGGTAVSETAKMSREVPMGDRSAYDQITERPNTLVEALCFDSPFGRDGDSHLSVLTSKVADLVSAPLKVGVVAHNAGMWIYTPTGTEKNPSVSDETKIDQWLAVLENCVINHLESTRLLAPQNSFKMIKSSERRLTVTVQSGTPDYECADGVFVSNNLRFVVTAGSSSRDYNDGESNRVILGTVYGRASLTHNCDYYGGNSRDDERPLRLSLSLNGVETNVPAPAFTQLLIGAILKSIDEDNGNDVRQATIPLKNEAGYREFAALVGANGIKNFAGAGGEFGDDILASPGQFLSMVTNRGVDVRVDYDLTNAGWAATIGDLFLAAYGTKSAAKAATDRVYGGIEAYFGIQMDTRHNISSPAGIQYTGSLQVGNQQRSLQSFDLVAGLTCMQPRLADVDTPAALDWSDDAPSRLLTMQAALLKRHFPTANYVSIAFGFRLEDDFMDALMDALGDAGFTVRNIGTGADMQMGRATHYAHSRFASGRRNGGSRGYNGRNFG